MKKMMILSLAIGLFFSVKGQLVAKPKCPTFEVDILDGKVEGLKPNARWDEIKAKLPCYTSADPEGTTAKCGATVFYKDRDIYFYTDRDYIEIKDKFKGKLSIPLLGASRNSLFKWLGNPRLKDENWDAFQMSYGLLVLHYNKAGKVYLMQFTTKGPDNLSLCE